MPKTEYTIEPGKQELVSTIVMDAPRELVFRAYTDPELFGRWWGPRRYKNRIEKFDSRSGGEWRVVQVGEGFPGHVALQTATFEAVGNKTKITALVVFQTVMDRDGMVDSGMRDGADESMERLAELLVNMKA